MNPKVIATIALFFLGILAFLYALSMIQMLIVLPAMWADVEGGMAPAAIADAFGLLVLLIAGWWLITRRHRLAAWIVDAPPFETPAEASDVPALLFALFGLYLVISTLPDLGAMAGQIIAMRAFPNVRDAVGVSGGAAGGYVGTLFQLIVGGFLFLNAHAVAQWWTGRTPKPQPAADPEPSSLPVCPNCGTPFDPSEYDSGAPDRRCSACKTVLTDVFD